MPEYQLELKQIVDYPRCRIYRQFVQSLIADRSLHTHGGSGLFYYTVLCSYANFRTSYRRLEGITYTVYPGEWVCRISELKDMLRFRFQSQALDVLENLQCRGLIAFTQLGHGHLVKYRIAGWRHYNTILDYNCPCQKDTGFFFMPVSIASELVGAGRVSEMDAVLDLWLNTIYNDERVLGSDAGPVVYFRNGTGNPLISYSNLALRWGRSRTTVGRMLKKLSARGYLELLSFPGRSGSVIYLNNYLSTMFQVSDVMLDKQEVAMIFKLNLKLPDETPASESEMAECPAGVSNQPGSVSKSGAEILTRKVAQILEAQGVTCCGCPRFRIKLYSLSGNCKGIIETVPVKESGSRCAGMAVMCGNTPVYRFKLTLLPCDDTTEEGGAGHDTETH